MGAPDQSPEQETQRREVSAGVVALVALVLGIVLLAGLGAEDPLGSITGAVAAIASSGVFAALYVLGAWGLGGLARFGFAGSREASAIQLGVGLALMLTLSYGLGALGLLNPLTAIATVGLGLVLGAVQVVRTQVWRRVGTLAWAPMCWLGGIALLAVASASPAGWLWGSEFGGYDALSYHLQLPQEWIAAGRIEPVTHNVYSYLPSYVESAFVHLGHMTFAPREIVAGDVHMGLLAGSGWRALMPQYLHAALVVASAWLVRRMTIALLIDRCSTEEDRQRLDVIGWLAGALVVSTPWVIVVGSLAYNEVAVVALGAAAMITAVGDGMRPAMRGALVGLLVGVACGAKPTALFLVGGPVGVVLVGSWVLGRGSGVWGLGSGAGGRGRGWVGALGVVVGVGCVVGVAALAPWLVRNAVHGGNPVFPQLTGVFGSAHWSAEQVAKYAAAHRFDGSVGERLALAVLPDEGEYRGMSHPQWMAFWLAVVAGMIASIARRETRRAGVIVGVGLGVGLVSWLGLTHIQSRFLLPMVPTGMLAMALGAWSLSRDRRVGARALAVVVAIQALASAGIFLSQRDGAPNLLTGVGPAYFSGEHARRLLGDVSERGVADRLRGLEQLGQVPATAMMNLALESGEAVLMIGDATAFYVRPPVRYHTTWDRSPLREMMLASPGEPGAWTRGLRAMGVRYVDISFGELARLGAEGWYDDAVTAQRVGLWSATLGEPVLGWPEIGRVVFDLERADTP